MTKHLESVFSLNFIGKNQIQGVPRNMTVGE